MNNKKDDLQHNLITALMVLSIAVIAFMAYRDVLGYFFTGIDTVAIIESVRIFAVRDIIPIFSKPLAADTPMPQVVQACYRPVCSLLFSLDYALWGLSPFGFNLTNVLLHVLVSVISFFVVRLLTKRRSIAFISSLLFTLHPVLVEGVSATVRRYDTLITLFILLSLFSFLKYSDSLFKKTKHLAVSIIFYALALGTKEIAVIFPFMIFAYLIFISFSEEISFARKFYKSLKKSLPYIVASMIFIALRTYVIGGIGGYVSKTSGAAAAAQVFIKIGAEYFITLLYPVDFLRIGALFSPYQTAAKQSFFLIILSALLICAAVFRGKIIKTVISDTSKTVNFLRSALAALSAVSLICILSYPLIAPYINRMMQLAYEGTGPQFLIDQMNSRDSYSVEIYLYKARDIILETFFLLLLSSSACLWATYVTGSIKRFPSGSFNLRLTFFLLCWMLLPLGLYLVTSVAGRYYLYIAVIPLTSILAIIIVEGFHYTLRKATKGASLISLLFNNWKIPGFALAVLMSVSFIFYSPLFNDYGEWKDSGVIMHSILSKLGQALPGLPDDAVLHIHNYPDSISSYKKVIPHAEEVVYMNDYNIESWLRMNFPGNKIKIIIESRQELPNYPHELELGISDAAGKDVNVYIKYYWNSNADRAVYLRE